MCSRVEQSVIHSSNTSRFSCWTTFVSLAKWVRTQQVIRQLKTKKSKLAKKQGAQAKFESYLSESKLELNFF